jgi:hypothetical protein
MGSSVTSVKTHELAPVALGRASDKVGTGPERWRPRRLKPSGVPPERAGFRRSHALSRRGRQRSADFVTGPVALGGRPAAFGIAPLPEAARLGQPKLIAHIKRGSAGEKADERMKGWPQPQCTGRTCRKEQFRNPRACSMSWLTRHSYRRSSWDPHSGTGGLASRRPRPLHSQPLSGQRR